MTKKEWLILKLNELTSSDVEANHCDADSLLLDYINDPEITEAYDKVEKWYA